MADDNQDNSSNEATSQSGGGAGTAAAWSNPDVVFSSPDGIAAVTPKDAILSAGNTFSLIAGQDINLLATGNYVTAIKEGLSIFTYGKASNPNKPNQETGIKLHAASGGVSVQAQSGPATLTADKAITIASTNDSINIAAKGHVLMTAGGAYIKLEGGNIEIHAPGMVDFKATAKELAGPQSSSVELPVFPVSDIKPLPQRKIDSTFAYDQLKGVAQRCTKAEFIALVVPIFGFDIPATTYIKLYEGMRSGSVSNPVIKLMSGGHYPASFDNKTKEIHVHWIAADRASSDPAAAWLLLTALLHEFGHYIDAVLRHDLVEKNADGTSSVADDAPGDEGAKFAYEIAFFDFEGSSNAIFANYISPEHSGPLKVNYGAARTAIRKSQDEEAQRDEGKSGSKEHFGAGRGEHYKEHPNESFGHQSIEDALIASGDIFKDRDVRLQIYFGNWLRDYSQIMDPKIVRRPSAPKDLTRYLSRDALTKIIDVLAEDEFVKKANDKKLFNVTPERLGVYRPTEHIDNPNNNDPNAVDPQSVDPDFEPLPSKHSLGIDPVTSMKRYIAASATYMKSELHKAVAAGATADGFRHFGGALHVLEDYFAHSNFVELSLRKMGYTKVLPWTSTATGKHPFPIVTGMFGSEDVIASVGGMVADILFKVELEFKPSMSGERNKADRLTLIILGEHSDPTYLNAYKSYLSLRDQYAKLPGIHQLEYLKWLMSYTAGIKGTIKTFLLNSLTHLIANSVDDGQVLFAGDPNTNGSTNPSHSQLAKDHDNHAFHALASTLAKHAVKEVGVAIAASWAGDNAANPAKIAADFFVHPLDCHWQDDIVKNWAAAHPKQVKRGESSTEWEALHKQIEKESRGAINKVEKNSKATWDYINKYYDTIFGEKNQVKK